MFLENYKGVRMFTVLSINNQYFLREKDSGDVIVSPYESLKDLRGAKRNKEGIIVPGEKISLYCKWSAGKWCVYPLRPYQQNFIDIIEDEHNEFKENGLYSLSEDVAAFSNSKDGGTIYWGVKDDGTVCGIENLVKRYGGQDKLSSILRNKIKQTLNSLVFLSIRFEYVVQARHTILKINVPPSSDIVLVKGDSLYVRADNTSQKLSGENLIAFFRMKLNATNNC